MKFLQKWLGALAMLSVLTGGERLWAQGTAFTYQGLLSQNGSPASGTDDLAFTLYATNGVTLGVLTNSAMVITNGLFTVTLDFGANSFSNAPRWLQIGVRPTGGSNGFTTLFPPQTITPSPQAIFAGTAAGVVNGAVTAAGLSPGIGADGQVLKMSGGALTWGTDLNSGGTISNLTTGLGLLGGIITSSGTVAIDPNVVPQLRATNNFIGAENLTSGNAASPALVVNGAASQTANLQEWHNSSGTVVASVNPSGTFSGNGSGLTSLNGAAITANTIPATAITSGQVVKSLNGLMDNVTLAPGNNMILATNANTLTFNTAPGLLSWLVVTGTTQTAQSNKGYLLTNTAQATVTLPSAPSLADIVRVSGISTNGWMIAQNAGQSILVKNLPGNIGVTWTARSISATSLAASSDGSHLVAAQDGGSVYTSTNFGVNWTTSLTSAGWSGVASSSDGSHLLAAIGGGSLYTSTNYGLTWSPHASSLAWSSVASSANASLLAAALNGGLIYFSTDNGNTWTPFTGAPGGFLVIVGNGPELIDFSGLRSYSTTNTGTTWMTNTLPASFNCAAVSSDGTKLVAAVSNGQIYTSADSGVTWSAHDSNRLWSAVASSADGTHLAATVSSGQIYISADSGMTWIPHTVSRNWTALTSSQDGTHLTAAGGSVYTSDNINPVTTTGQPGYLLGTSNSAVELQYIGNNTFMPLSSSGFVTGN